MSPCLARGQQRTITAVIVVIKVVGTILKVSVVLDIVVVFVIVILLLFNNRVAILVDFLLFGADVQV